MRRRQFVSLLGGTALSWPLAARAQQPERVRRIGVMMPYAESDPEAQGWLTVFRAALEKLGWTVSHNIEIDTRWDALDADSKQRVAKVLVALQPNLILSQSTPTTAALLEQTRTIPVVFIQVLDPSFIPSFFEIKESAGA